MVRSPRRRWVGLTATAVTPAMGSFPPGTVTGRDWAPAVATIVPASNAARDRSNSKIFL